MLPKRKKSSVKIRFNKPVIGCARFLAGNLTVGASSARDWFIAAHREQSSLQHGGSTQQQNYAINRCGKSNHRRKKTGQYRAIQSKATHPALTRGQRMVMGAESGARCECKHSRECGRACHHESHNQPDPPGRGDLLQECQCLVHGLTVLSQRQQRHRR